ncbi:MAG: MBL fold metallo-hydrolase, partial [Promethearchaeota archaeon]
MVIESLSTISDGVHLLIPPPDRIAGWRRSGNVVLLEGEEALVLIDSGGPSLKRQLAKTVPNFLRNDMKKVHCFHTHGHIDHMAGAPMLKELFGAGIWAPAEAVPFVEKQSPIFMERERQSLVVGFRELFTAPSWFVKAAMRVTLGRAKPLSSIETLVDTSALRDTGFRSIPLPGHHLGHTGFFDDEKLILIAGDLFDPRHRMKPILSSPSSDFQQMKESLETVLRLSPAYLLPGHGSPMIGKESIQKGVEMSLSTMHEALEAVESILEKERCSLPELSSRLTRMGLGPGDVFR